MVLNHSWETSSWSTIQEILKILRTPKGHYSVHNSAAIGLYHEPHSSRPYPHSIYLRPILMLSSHIRPGVLICDLPATFTAQTLYKLSPMLAKCPTHHILLDFIILMILLTRNKSYEAPYIGIFTSLLLFDPSWSRYSQYPVPVHPQSMFSPLIWETKFRTHKNLHAALHFWNFKICAFK
jgi:hypothetical protein